MLEQIKFAVQINGKTRDVINIKKNTNEDEVSKIVLTNSKANKFQKKKVFKTIFEQNN